MFTRCFGVEAHFIYYFLIKTERICISERMFGFIHVSKIFFSKSQLSVNKLPNETVKHTQPISETRGGHYHIKTIAPAFIYYCNSLSSQTTNF